MTKNSDTFVIQLGKNLKAARLKAGMTANQVSEITGNDISYIYNVENGKLTNVTIKTLWKIAKAIDHELTVTLSRSDKE